jgi:hypothetical protein
VGFKPSGGIRTVADAALYIALTAEHLGAEALTPRAFASAPAASWPTSKPCSAAVRGLCRVRATEFRLKENPMRPISSSACSPPRGRRRTAGRMRQRTFHTGCRPRR